MGGEYTLAATDQRHRAVFNGIWEAPYGLQLSGVYFYGSGLRFSTSVGGDERGQATGGENRYRITSTAVGPADDRTSKQPGRHADSSTRYVAAEA